VVIGIAPRVAHTDGGDLDAASGAAQDFILVTRQHVERAAANGAQAEQADLDRVNGHGHGYSDRQPTGGP
jgi:hypothetical protein